MSNHLYTHRPHLVAAFQWDGVVLVAAKLFVADWLGGDFSVQTPPVGCRGRAGGELLEVVRSATVTTVHPGQWIVVRTNAVRAGVFDVLDDAEFQAKYQPVVTS